MQADNTPAAPFRQKIERETHTKSYKNNNLND